MGYYERVFARVDYRILIFITPLIGILLVPVAMNIPLGIDFTGGTEVQILMDRPLTGGQLSSALSQCSQDLDIHVQPLGDKSSAIIKTKDEISKECLDRGLSSLGFTDEELKSVLPSTFRPELGRVLMKQGSNVLAIAGILMILIVFISFRSIIPSVAVVQAAVFDIIIAMGILSILGFELNLAGVAALLMLIGYSIDTDIMLTSRILRQADKPLPERINQAFTTGITMTGTTLAAMSAIFIVTLFINIDTITQISSVLLAGLVADLATTWLTNVAILKWHAGRSGLRSSRFKFSLFRS